MNGPVKVSVKDSIRTEIEIRGHSFVADEPTDKGGADEGPAPGELFLASLAACTAMTLRMYANVKEWPLEGVAVSIVQERTDDGPLITMRISISGDLDESQGERMKYIARRCPVHRVVTEDPKVVHEFVRE